MHLALCWHSLGKAHVCVKTHVRADCKWVVGVLGIGRAQPATGSRDGHLGKMSALGCIALFVCVLAALPLDLAPVSDCSIMYERFVAHWSWTSGTCECSQQLPSRRTWCRCRPPWVATGTRHAPQRRLQHQPPQAPGLPRSVLLNPLLLNPH